MKHKITEWGDLLLPSMAFVRDAEEVAQAHTVGGLSPHRQCAHMANVEADARTIARDWLLKVKTTTRLSWTAIAREAGIAASTLTKMANDPEHPHTLSTRTIAKISRRFGIAAPSTFSDGPLTALVEAEAAPYAFDGPPEFNQLVRDFIAGRAHLEPWRLSTRALELAGYLPDDVVLLDTDTPPRAGDVVAAEAYDFARGRTDLLWRRYQPPFLFAASADPGFRPIAADEAGMKGTVVMSFRPRYGDIGSPAAAPRKPAA